MSHPQLPLLIPVAVLIVLAAYPTAYWVCLEPRSRRGAVMGIPAAVLFVGAQLALIWMNWPR
ncbi:MAG: hypothetical protein F4Z31_01605 [Gemmatimonadetes bacterium]|nr:hypothetical protein [Gemmatimonadota bacterium]